MEKIKKTMRYKGTVLVEAALVFPLLLLLTLGAIEYGWIFLKSQQITNAARHGARIAVRADATTQEVLASINNLMTSAGMGNSGYEVEIVPSDVSSVEPTFSIRVKITVPCANVALINAPVLLPTPTTLGSAVSMVKEGPYGGS